MYWSELIAPILWACLLLLVPGYALAWAAGWGRERRLFLAPLLSVGAISVSAVLLQPLGVRWSPAAFGLTLLTALLVVLALRCGLHLLTRRSRRRSTPRADASGWALWGAALLGAAVGAASLLPQLRTMLINPDAVSQSYDNIFHLNAVRWIADTGHASSLGLGAMITADGSPSFYPAAWHDLVSLVLAVFPDSIPAATNAVTIAVAALAWPLSVVGLALSLPRRSRCSVAAAGVLSGALLAYPGLMLKWGILYPNLLGYALLPAFLVVLGDCIARVRGTATTPALPTVIGLLGGTAGLALAHPNALTSAAVLTLPRLISAGLAVLRDARADAPHRAPWAAQPAAAEESARTAPSAATASSAPVPAPGADGSDSAAGPTGSVAARRRPRRRAIAVRLGLLGLAFAACLLIWWKVRPSADTATWPPTLTEGRALGEFIAQSFNGNGSLWILSALILIGAWSAARTARLRWLVGAWALTGWLWVAVVGMQEGPLRSFLAGPWYNDAIRLAALTAIPSVILAALGADALTRAVLGAARRVGPGARTGAAILMALLVLLGGFQLGRIEPMRAADASVAKEFEVKKDSLVLTADEIKVLEHVDQYVPADGTIVVNPWEGSALAYALEDRQTTFKHSLSPTPDRYRAIIEDLDDAAEHPEVCREVRAEHARWYLDFEDTLDIGAPNDGQYPGLGDLVGSDMVRPLYTSGPVGLYEITGCGS